MKPTKNTKFLPISELVNYQSSDYFCFAVVFSPETENQHFDGCPPYIGIGSNEDVDLELFFKIPDIVAYYAKTHPNYTMQGMDKRIEEGKRILANEIKSLLNIE